LDCAERKSESFKPLRNGALPPWRRAHAAPGTKISMRKNVLSYSLPEKSSPPRGIAMCSAQNMCPDEGCTTYRKCLPLGRNLDSRALSISRALLSLDPFELCQALCGGLEFASSLFFYVVLSLSLSLSLSISLSLSLSLSLYIFYVFKAGIHGCSHARCEDQSLATCVAPIWYPRIHPSLPGSGGGSGVGSAASWAHLGS